MKHTSTKILILLGALALLIAGVSAAPIYQIETGNLAKDTAGGNDGYYILNGYNLTLPLNITYISDTYISSLIANTTVLNKDDARATAGYGYTLNSIIPTTFAGATKDKEWYYQVATGDTLGFNGTMPDALTINVTGLTVAENPYSVSIKILAADLNADVQDLGSEIVSLGKNVNVYYLYQDNTETNEAEWSMTIPLTATANVLTGKDVPSDTTFTIPWDKITVTRGSASLDLPFTVWKLDSGDWVEAPASKVTQDTNALTITIDGNDAGAEDYKLLFEGRQLGDVSDINNAEGNVNIMDADAMIQYATSKDSKHIADDRLIYGDLYLDGAINSNDAVYLAKYLVYGTDSTLSQA